MWAAEREAARQERQRVNVESVVAELAVREAQSVCSEETKDNWCFNGVVSESGHRKSSFRLIVYIHCKSTRYYSIGRRSLPRVGIVLVMGLARA